MRKKLTAIASAVMSVSALSLNGCGLVDGPPFEPKRLEQIQMEAAAQNPTEPIRPVPTTMESPMP
ncbi:MAG TPA: hypothetical protein VHP11_16270, partial [Tepidisphaeraceae bacterium]|nr:hypothetical protein [Tepidisphaeraceae bacterium]